MITQYYVWGLWVGWVHPTIQIKQMSDSVICYWLMTVWGGEEWLKDWKPCVDLGGRFSDQFYYIHQCYHKIKFEKKKPWRAHCKISYHHIIYFTNTTNVNCNVWKWKMSNWQMNQICLMRAYTRWNRSWTHTVGFFKRDSGNQNACYSQFTAMK